MEEKIWLSRYGFSDFTLGQLSDHSSGHLDDWMTQYIERERLSIEKMPFMADSWSEAGSEEEFDSRRPKELVV
jgi:hypothetical protein